MRDSAEEPDDLEKLFVERANAGDVDGLVALYEPGAVLVSDDGRQFTGTDQIREFFIGFLMNRSPLAKSRQSPALLCGEIALTSSVHGNGEKSVEIARRQPDGRWLWAVDRFAV